MVRSIAFGAAASVLWTFPLAAVTALVFRFPVPLAGYMRGVEAILPSQIANLVYGVLGGFPVLALFGGLAAWGIRSKVRAERSTRLIAIAGFFLATIEVAILATLDYFIGPW